MKVTRRQFLQIAGVLGITAGIPSAVELGYATRIETRRVFMEERPIRLERLPAAFEGFKIALFSDLHLYPFTPIQMVQDAVKLANSFRPDLVILAGDFVWLYVDAAFDLVPVLSQLNPSKGTFAVLGNHDHRKGPEVVAKALSEAGVQVLRNRGVTIQIGHDSIYLAGIDSVRSGAPSPSAAFENKRGDLVSVVTVHEPDYIPEPRTALPGGSSAFRTQSRRSGTAADGGRFGASGFGRNL